MPHTHTHTQGERVGDSGEEKETVGGIVGGRRVVVYLMTSS